jgi:hypothetical protein
MDKRVVGFVALTLLGCGSSSEETRKETTTPAKESQTDEGVSSADPHAVSAEKLLEIDEFFKHKAGQLQFTCYNPEVEKTHQKYEGKVAVSIIVAPGNKLSEVKITGSSLKSPGIEACLLAEMKQWEWPDVPGPAPYWGEVTFKPAW